MRILIILLLVLVLSINLASQQTIIFSEVENGYNLLEEQNEKTETSLLIISDLYLDKPKLTLTLSNKLEQYTGNYDLTNFSTAFSCENRFHYFSNNSFLQYRESQIEAYKIIEFNNSLLWDIEQVTGQKNIGFNINWLNCLEPFDYKEITGTVYLIKKDHFKALSLHNIIEVSLKRLSSNGKASDLLTYLYYQIKLSKPLIDNVGITFELDINHNLSKEDRILIPNADFYNSASYNSQSFGAGLTFILGEHLIKPELSLISRQFLKVAVEEQFGEIELASSLYYDVILPGNLLLYADLDFSRIEDDTGWNSVFTACSGLKYQFDIYVRE